MSFLVLLLLVSLLLASSVHAFGAGYVPEASSVARYSFRHGTIEQIIEKLAKVAAASASGGVSFNAGGILKDVAGTLLSGGNFAQLGNTLVENIGGSGGGGQKFTGLDAKRVYFGNWLRDYSQAVDTAGLSKLSADSIVLVIQILGFLAFGYGTAEFEVTKDRLGVYRPEEHIDNPGGYPSNAQQFDRRLRGPVDEGREMSIDERTGMKKYIAAENQGFATSAQCIREHLTKAIEMRRRGDEHGAYRELGTGQHTLEVFLAHSNYCELALQKLGQRDVFDYVGENVRVRAPSGETVAPIVTGTFGSADFMISVFGEVGDKLASTTVDTLTEQTANAQQADNSNGSGLLKALLDKLPSNSNTGNVDAKIQNVENIKKNAVNIDPDTIATEEVQQIFVDVVKTRDQIFKEIEQVLEKFGLDALVDELATALSVFVLTAISPYIKGIVKQVQEAVTTGSEAILQQEDQMQIFNDSNCSDPTHSVISKDHYDNLINEPAGLCAQAVVKHTVQLVVNAWTNHHINIDETINKVLEAIHHPFFATGNSQIQRDMLDTVKRWIEGKRGGEREKILRGLTKERVQKGENKIEESDSYGQLGHRCAGKGHAHRPGQSHAQGRPGGNQGGASAFGSASSGQQQSSYGGRRNDGDEERRKNNQGGYNSNQQSFGSSQQQSSYAGRNDNDYERRNDSYGRQDDNVNDNNYGRSSSAGYGNTEDRQNTYGHRHDNDNNEPGYGRTQHGDSYNTSSGDRVPDHLISSNNQYGGESNDNEGRGSYGRSDDSEHGRASGRRHANDNDNERSSYGQNQGYASQSQYGRNDNESVEGRMGQMNLRSSENEYGRGDGGRNEYGGHQRRDDNEGRGEGRHGGGHGGGRRNNDDDNYGRGYGRRD